MRVRHFVGFAHQEFLQLAVARRVGVVKVGCKVAHFTDMPFALSFHLLAWVARLQGADVSLVVVMAGDKSPGICHAHHRFMVGGEKAVDQFT